MSPFIRPLSVVLLFAFCVCFYTRDNDFPFFYHPDEPDKVRQVIEGTWNFHHPLLMLATTRLVVSAFGIPDREQRVVEIGRWISAVFSAVGVVALAVLARRWRGDAAFWATGLLLALHHQIFELSHYFKEDAALFMAIALTLLAVDRFWQTRTVGAVVLLGIGCGLSVSAKYLGIVAAVPALIALIAAKSHGKRIALFFLVMAVTFAAANFPIVTHYPRFRQSFEREVSAVTQGQRGMTRSVPNTEYFSVARDNATPAIWLLLIAYFIWLWRERKKRSLPEKIIAMFPFAYALLLACSPKTNDRYFLPASASLTMLAALGAIDASRRLSSSKLIAGGLVAGAVACQLVTLPNPFDWRTVTEYVRAFRRDDRAEMRVWLRQNLPADATIAQDSRVLLPHAGTPESRRDDDPLPQTVLDAKALAKNNTLDDLRRAGATHLILSQSDYGRYFRRSYSPQAGYAGEFARRAGFYEDAMKGSELLWKRPRGTVVYLHPGLEVYRVRNVP